MSDVRPIVTAAQVFTAMVLAAFLTGPVLARVESTAALVGIFAVGVVVVFVALNWLVGKIRGEGPEPETQP